LLQQLLQRAWMTIPVVRVCTENDLTVQRIGVMVSLEVKQ